MKAPPILDPAAWPALAPAVALMVLGVVFIAAPGLGGAIFGMPAPEGDGAAWLAVVGLRDFAFGGYVLALALLGDVLILLALRGLSSPGHLLLHLASAGVMAAAAAWMLRHPPSMNL
jgi:hypothetical protein